VAPPGLLGLIRFSGVTYCARSTVQYFMYMYIHTVEVIKKAPSAVNFETLCMNGEVILN
jgi:hypothetical protein